MFSPKTNYAKIAYDTILFFISTGQIRKENLDKISADLKLNRACIVSVYDSNNNLRGSYGDVHPLKEILYDEIIEIAKQNAEITIRDNSKLEILFFKSTRYD